MEPKDLGIQSIEVQKISHSHQHESLSMDSLACTSNLRKLESQITDEFPEIHARQDSIRLYHQIQKAIDVAAESNGELNSSKFNALVAKIKDDIAAKHAENTAKILPQDQKALARINEQFERRMKIIDEVNAMGNDMKKSGDKFSFDQRVRLTKNIENEISDINLQLNMDFQRIKKLSDQYHECMQLARTSAKTLHDIIMSNAKAAGGR